MLTTYSGHFSKSIAAKYDKKGRASYRSVKIIALNLERYISFEIQHLRFIDSCQFLNAKLEKLVNNLPTDSLRHTKRHMGDNELLFAKGIFPYEWFDSFGEVRLHRIAAQSRVLQQIGRRRNN
jgi:hypothetical protein